MVRLGGYGTETVRKKSRQPESKTGAGEPRWHGLSEAQALASRRANGDNRLSKQRAHGFWWHFFANLNDPVIRILLMALGLNLALMFRRADWVETLGIAASVLLATTISTVSQVGSQAAFAKLQEAEGGVRCRVLREGVVREISTDEVVVGDVVLLDAGENVPADGRLIEGAMTLDQMAMTGESRAFPKRADGENMGEPGDENSLFRGCAVMGGQGKMLVERVGDATMLGGISREVQSEVRPGPLQLRLGKLARQISVLGYAAAVLVALASLFYAFVIDSGFRPDVMLLKWRDITYVFDTCLEALMLGLTVIVVAVPEGLPMMIAVVLSANIRRMVKDHVLVRKPAGIEAAGSMDLLFTDKTGTLTHGRLSIGTLMAAEGDYATMAALRAAGAGRFERVLLACRQASEATVGERGGERAVLGGNATDRALVSAVLDWEAPAATVSARLPFDSARKFAAAVVRRRQGECLTLIKGAPELLLPHITGALDGQGRVVPLDRRAFGARVAARAKAGERVLLLAASEGAGEMAALERGKFPSLLLICALTLADRLRPEAAEAVATLQRAGVQVVMITGDGPETAAAIGRQCGIVNAKTDLVLTGRELATLPDSRLREMLPRLAVVARALPTDKSRLVRVAQEQERVVGMTGDGINDAPALRRADVGFAMGSGASVAREAGDILILDDNLASIVRAVLYGRNIFKSIRKFIALQLTMNLCAVGISMIGPFIGVEAPVTVVQMLWINLIMDTLGGLAFAGEAALSSCLQEAPKRREEPILNHYMVNEILWLGGYSIGLFVLFLRHPVLRALFRPMEGDLCHLTAFFALFIFTSVFHCFNARTDRFRPGAALSRNPLFIVIMLTILIVQIAFVYLGGSVLRTVPLTARELAMTALLAATVMPAELIRKWLWRTFRRQKGKY